MKRSNVFSLAAKFRNNAGAMIHKNPPRKRFRAERISYMSCTNCINYDIAEDRCELHGIDNLTDGHTCADHKAVEYCDSEFVGE